MNDSGNGVGEPADLVFMRRAIELAQHAESIGEVPVGAVLVKGGEIIAEGWNYPVSGHDPTCHAEIDALRKAAQQLGNYRLLDTTLYVTLEPCVMCAGAMIHARIKRLVFAAFDPKTGAAGSVFDILSPGKLNHSVDVCGGVGADQCGDLLRDFFKRKRSGDISI